MIKAKNGKILGWLVLFLIILMFWETVCYLKIIDTFFLPSPSEIIKTAYKMLKIGELQYHFIISLKRLLLGFFLGTILGLAAGSFCGLSKKISTFIEPLIYLIYPIPRFALLPFIILIFGTGMLPKVIFIGMGAFFPTAIGTISGINHIDKGLLEAARYYGAKGWKLYKRVILPGSLPSIFAGQRISLGLTVSYVTVIEFLTAIDGLGAMMWLSLQTLRIDKLFLSAIIIALTNTVFIALLKVAERLLTPWSKEEKDIIL